MKFLKYISICLLAVIAASCSKEDIKYPIEDVDPSQAQIQVAYMCPKAAITANYIYTVVINGQKYSNNGSSFLATYNYVPSASAGLFYVVKAGEVSIQFLDKDNKEVYNQKVTVAEGSRQMVVVYDFAKAPAVVPTKEPLKFPGVSATGDKCSVRLYNFLFESEGVPMTDKIQYGIQNIETKVYEPVGTPIAFGEATDFIPVDIDKEGLEVQASIHQVANVAMYASSASTLKLAKTKVNSNSPMQRARLAHLPTIGTGQSAVATSTSLVACSTARPM